jgi:hypothetical protein
MSRRGRSQINNDLSRRSPVGAGPRKSGGRTLVLAVALCLSCAFAASCRGSAKTPPQDPALLQLQATTAAPIVPTRIVPAAGDRSHPEKESVVPARAPGRPPGPREADRMASFRRWVEKERVVNGIDLQQVVDFWKSWSLVNVRYRKDNDEQRFVYANDIAWKAMQDNRVVYPDNAMFAKVAFNQRADPAFPNSMQPIGLIRVQLMKKNQHDFPNSNGWGYALFVPFFVVGPRQPGSPPSPPPSGDPAVDDVRDSRVCHVCHSIVKDRDYVFTQPAFFETPQLDAERYAVEFHDKFRSRPVAELSPYARSIVHATIGDEHPEVRFLSMRLFSGSVNESIGPLIEYAARDSTPYLLLDDEERRFLLTYPAPVTAGCQTVVYAVQSIFELPARQWKLLNDRYCDGKGRGHVAQPLPPELIPHPLAK